MLSEHPTCLRSNYLPIWTREKCDRDFDIWFRMVQISIYTGTGCGGLTFGGLVTMMWCLSKVGRLLRKIGHERERLRLSVRMRYGFMHCECTCMKFCLTHRIEGLALISACNDCVQKPFCRLITTLGLAAGVNEQFLSYILKAYTLYYVYLFQDCTKAIMQ